MTYNFDPDRWYAIELEALRTRRRNRDIGEIEFQELSETLQQRYDRMLDRLDGTYQIPHS